MSRVVTKYEITKKKALEMSEADNVAAVLEFFQEKGLAVTYNGIGYSGVTGKVISHVDFNTESIVIEHIVE